MNVTNLFAAPFSHNWGSTVYAKVSARNSIGNSTLSSAGSGTVLITFPDPPKNLVNVPLVTNTTNIGLTWTKGESDGGSSVIDHRVWWDQGSNNFDVLVSGVPDSYYTTSVTLNPNMSYKFKVDSRNIWGFSLQSSNIVSIVAASKPSPW